MFLWILLKDIARFLPKGSNPISRNRRSQKSSEFCTTLHSSENANNFHVWTKNRSELRSVFQFNFWSKLDYCENCHPLFSSHTPLEAFMGGMVEAGRPAGHVSVKPPAVVVVTFCEFGKISIIINTHVLETSVLGIPRTS